MKALETMRYIAPILFFLLWAGCANEQVQIAEDWEAEAEMLEAEAEKEAFREALKEVADAQGSAEYLENLTDWGQDWSVSNHERSWRLWRVEWEESSREWKEKAERKRLEAQEEVVEAWIMGDEREARAQAAYANMNNAELREEYQQRLEDAESMEGLWESLEGFDWGWEMQSIKVYSSEAEARAATAAAEAWEAAAEAWEEGTEAEARAATAEARAEAMAELEAEAETIVSEYLYYGQWRTETAEREVTAFKEAKAAWTIAAKAWEVNQEAEAWAMEAEAWAAEMRAFAIYYAPDGKETEAAAEAWEAVAEAWKEGTEAEARAATAEARAATAEAREMPAAAKAWEAAAMTWNAVDED